MNDPTIDFLADEQAATIVAQVNAGTLDEAAARHALAQLPNVPHIVGDVARKATTRERGHRDDVQSHIMERVLVKILVPSDNSYSFERANGSSFSAYVRRLAQSIAPTAMRDVVYEPRRRTVPLDTRTQDDYDQVYEHGVERNRGMNRLLDDAVAHGGAVRNGVLLTTKPSYGADTDLVSAEEAGHHQLVDDFLEGISHVLRKSDYRPHYYASIVLHATGITSHAQRPLLLPKRQRILAQLTAADGADTAMRSLRAAQSGSDQLDGIETLVDLWGDWTSEDITVLIGHGPEAVLTVAVAAASPYPLPNARARSRLAANLESISSEPTYRQMVADVVRSLLAYECCHASPTDPDNLFTLTNADAAGYRGIVGHLAVLPGAPLGRRSSDVMEALRTHLTLVLPDMSFAALQEASRANLAKRSARP